MARGVVTVWYSVTFLSFSLANSRFVEDLRTLFGLWCFDQPLIPIGRIVSTTRAMAQAKWNSSSSLEAYKYRANGNECGILGSSLLTTECITSLSRPKASFEMFVIDAKEPVTKKLETGFQVS